MTHYIDSASIANLEVTGKINASEIAGTASLSLAAVSASYLSASNSVVNTLTVTGLLTAGQISSSQIYITSSQLSVAANILTLNAMSPHLRYTGLEMYDSGSTENRASFLWDGQNNYFLFSSSDAGYSRKIITGPNNEGNLLTNYIPLNSDNNSISNSIISQSNGTIFVDGDIKCNNITASLLNGTASYASTASYVNGLNLNSIASGSMTAIVNTSQFIVNSGSNNLMVVSSSGKVGIGTNPLWTFDVTVGSRDPNQVSDGLGIRPSVGVGQMGLGFNGDNYGWIQTYNKPLYINYLGNNILMGAGNAKIGINATSPSAKLHISGSSNAETELLIQNNSGSNLLFVSSSGNVGIGTTSSVNKLDVVGNISCSVITASLLNGTSSFSNTASLAVSASYANYAETAYIGSGTTNALTKWNNNQLTSSVIYDNGGKIGINNISPVYVVDVNGDIGNNNGDLFIQSAGYNTVLNNDAGYVGIGKSIPEYKLDVTGDINFTGNLLKNGSAYIQTSSSYATTASYALNGGGSGTQLTTGSTYPITSSWAVTASYALNGGGSVTGNTGSYLSAQAIVLTSQTIPSNVATPVSFSSTVWDDLNFHDSSINNTRMTAPFNGKYRATSHVRFTDNGNGGTGVYRQAGYFINGQSTQRQGVMTLPPFSSGSNIGINTTAIFDLNAGDYVETFFQHNSTASMPLFQGTSSRFTFEYLGTYGNALSSSYAQLSTQAVSSDFSALSQNSVSSSYAVTASFVQSIPGYINGFNVRWVNSASIQISNGTADIEAYNSLFSVTSSWTTVTGSSLGNLVHNYVYLTPSGTFEISSTPPVTYYGTAMSKTGDNTRRFIFPIVGTISGNITKFVYQQSDGCIMYPQYGFVRVLSNGKATTPTRVWLSGSVPPIADSAIIVVSNNDTLSSSWIGDSGLTTASAYMNTYVSSHIGLNVPITSQSLYYMYATTPTNGTYIDVSGYYFNR